MDFLPYNLEEGMQTAGIEVEWRGGHTIGTSLMGHQGEFLFTDGQDG